MHQNLFISWFTYKTQETHDDSTVPIYIDATYTSNIRIEIKQNMLVSDILQFIHGDDKQQLDLILVNENVQRRLWDYEKLEDVLNTNCKLVIWDFTKKQLQHIHKSTRYFDDNFRAYGKLMKKNKLGIYVLTQVYLSSSYFGFKNERKEKIKLSPLENVKLYTWSNNTRFDFQIENERKLYFFQAMKQTDFDYWIKCLKASLIQAGYKTLYQDQEQLIFSATQKQINKIEEYAQATLQHVSIRGNYLQKLKSQITDICDVNIIQFLLTKDEDLIPHIRKQIYSDTFQLLQPLEPQGQVQALCIFTPRFHLLFDTDNLENLVEKLTEEINSTYLDFIKIQQIESQIVQQHCLQFKEQFQQFQPNFDQFYA